MCGGGAPTTPTVDPAAERQKAADEAAAKANAALVNDARRKRGQQGLLSTESKSGTVLSRSSDGPLNFKWSGNASNVMKGVAERMVTSRIQRSKIKDPANPFSAPNESSFM